MRFETSGIPSEEDMRRETPLVTESAFSLDKNVSCPESDFGGIRSEYSPQIAICGL